MTHLNLLLRVNHLLHCFLRLELLIIEFPLIASPFKAAINEIMVLGLLVIGISLYLTRLSAFVVILTYWRREHELPLYVSLLLNTSPFKAIGTDGI